jgi:hypothetical protein
LAACGVIVIQYLYAHPPGDAIADSLSKWFNLRATFQLLRSNRRAAAANQIENKDYERYDQERVNQTAAHMERKTQKPQHKQNHYRCPQHDRISFSLSLLMLMLFKHGE